MSVKEKIISDLNVLNESQLKQLADYTDFLKFNSKKSVKKQEKDCLLNLGKNPVSVGIADA